MARRPEHLTLELGILATPPYVELFRMGEDFRESTFGSFRGRMAYLPWPTWMRMAICFPIAATWGMRGDHSMKNLRVRTIEDVPPCRGASSGWQRAMRWR